MKDKIFYTAAFGFIIGVLLRSVWVVELNIALIIATVSAVAILFFSFVHHRIVLLFSVFVLVASLGVIRFTLYDAPNPERYESQMGNKVKFSGVIVADPESRSYGSRFQVRVDTEQHPFNVLVTASAGHNFEYGDMVTVVGKLEHAENFVTDTGKEFDYINYLKKDRILYTVSFADVDVVSAGHGNPIKKYLFRAKHYFVSKINYAIHKPESDLMAGYILGEKSNFSDELTDNFVRTGTIHMVALSGYNVTIIAEWIMKLFAFLGAASFYFGVAGIVLFVVMTGGLSTAVRAGIMAVLALIARRTGRTYEVGRGLVLAGVVMVLVNPMTLYYDVSFQLSFIATVAVIFVAPRTEKYFTWVTRRFELRDIISVTFAAYVFVLPFILYKMGNLSLVALPANFLVLPLIPLTMIMGFATGFIGMVSGFVSLLPGVASSWLLSHELLVINKLGALPFASLTISRFPMIIVLAIYAWFIYRLFGRDIKKFFKFEEEITW